MSIWWDVMNPFTFENGHVILKKDGTRNYYSGPFTGDWYYEIRNGDLVRVILEG